MHVIGVLGLIGSGKDKVGNYIVEKYHYHFINFSDIVKELATQEDRGHDRDELQNITKEYTDKYGAEYLGERAIQKIKDNGWTKVIIGGIRRLPELEVLRKEYSKDMFLILVDTNSKVRFERMKSRNRQGDPQTFEEFERQEQREFEMIPSLEGVLNEANFIIDNSGTKEELHNKIDVFMKDHSL